jgi:hypothetical protein
MWDHVHTALSPQGDELSPRGSWGICVPVLPEGLTMNIITLGGKFYMKKQGTVKFELPEFFQIKQLNLKYM